MLPQTSNKAVSDRLHVLLLQYPVLETPGGAIRESVAICRYVASLGARGLYPVAMAPSDDIRGQIDAWIDWSLGKPWCCQSASGTCSQLLRYKVLILLQTRPYAEATCMAAAHFSQNGHQ
jgi:glutathione S-transferase